MENNKSQAEIYREERKERLAKAAAKQAKKSPKLSKRKKLAGKVISIVLVVAIALGAVGGILNFFGVPQKVLKVSIGDSEYKFSVAEYNFYYYNTWYNYQNSAYQYDTYYGEGMGVSLLGYDYTQTPDEQEYTDDMSAMTGLTLEDLGNPEDATWADVFSYAAISQMLQVKYGAQKAEEAGIALTEDEEAEIEEYIESARDTATSNDYSLNRWLHSQIGKGLSEDLVYEIQKDTYLATAYYEKLETDTLNAITEDEVLAEYNENRKTYDLMSARIYTLSAVEASVADDATTEEKTAAEEKAATDTKAKADAFVAAVTDEESFIKEAQKAILTEDNESTIEAETSTAADDITYADLEYISEDLAEWAYDDARKVGDATAIANGDGTYTIIYVTVLPHKDTNVSSSDVRHILVAFETETDEDGNAIELTTAQKAEYKAEAQAILDEYLENPTVENFAELTKTYTDDVDSDGNPNNDGLYENVADDGSYVEAFTNWAVDSSRKPGDTGIIETEYGYHIMYYVESNGDAWYETVKDAIFAEKFAEVTDDILFGIMEEMKFDGAVLNWAKNKQCDFIGKIVINNF